MHTKILVALSAIGMATSASALTNILINPSFEMGSGVNSVKAAGSTDITGWTVLNGGVFYASTSKWNAFDGARSVEINGTGQGVLYQDVVLEVGKQYVFNYAYSVAPTGSRSGPGGTRASTPFTVSIRSANMVETYLRPVGHSATNMQYVTNSWVFTAVNKFNRVSFDSGNGGQYGIVVDAISLAIVPEPATWAMLIAGFGMVGFSMRRRRTGVASVTN